jgi:hypothetical protein
MGSVQIVWDKCGGIHGAGGGVVTLWEKGKGAGMVVGRVTYLIAWTPLPLIPKTSANVPKHSKTFLELFGDPKLVSEGVVGV